jgi:nucleotide-binding universal stress UspA family protein
MGPSKVLAAIDFSEGSRIALAWAVDLCQHSGAELVLVHASPPSALVDDPGAPPELEELARDALREIVQRLEKTRDEVIAKGVKASQILVDNEPARAILDVAGERGVDLIVVGAQGQAGEVDEFIGGVAEHVVRNARTNVLVARPAAGGVDVARRRLLVPSDFSTCAEQALALAMALVEPGGTVDLFHVWNPPRSALGHWTRSEETSVEAVESLETSFSQAARKKAEDLMARHAGDESSLEFVSMGHSSARKAILEQIQSDGYDLVVMGSRGRRGLMRWLMGSVAEATVRRVPCSVLVVRE